MASSDQSGPENWLKRALDTHGIPTVLFLIRAKSELGHDEYKELIRAVHEIIKQSSNPEGRITVQKCREILSQVFAARTGLLKAFHAFVDKGDPFPDCQESLLGAESFLEKVKASPYVSDDDYNAFMDSLYESLKTNNPDAGDVFKKAKRAMRQCPEFVEIFQVYLPPRLKGPLPNEQSCTSPTPTDKEVLCFTPDASYSSDGVRTKTTNMKSNASQQGYPHGLNHQGPDYSFRQKRTQRIPGSFQTSTKGDVESLHAEEYDGDNIDPLPDWRPSTENELPPKVDLIMCTPCSPSYFLLPENCLTLESSYWTELGQSVVNDTLVSSTSGREDCFKFRTKNQYEENIFKCEDDMFESDMLLQRFRATADFIGNLQDHVESKMKIQELLTPLHRRCIEQLYDEHGLDMLDALWEEIDSSTAIAILHSRLNQKIADLSEARLSLNKACSNIIANNYYKSLDHRSSSFKQLDKRRMSPKALLAEAKEINMTRLNDGDKHLSTVCSKQSSLISDDVLKYADLHINKDIDRMVRYALKSCPSEQKPMMILTKLVQPFVSMNYQLPASNGVVAPSEACERCGLSKTFRKNIPDGFIANNFPLSLKRGGYLVNTSNKSVSINNIYQTETEEGEFIPDMRNIQSGSMVAPGNGAASYNVAAPSFRCPGRSSCDHGNKSEACQETRECSDVEMGSLAYSKITAESQDVKGGIPCCSVVVLSRLYQILYERLLVAKVLSREASAKALSRDSRARDLYSEFKEKLFSLLKGSTNNSNFEEYCLNSLGPRSYVLFTLDELIGRVIRQLGKICPSAEDNSALQLHERGPNPSNDLLHQNIRSSPACPTNGPLEQDHQEEVVKGRRPLNDAVKPMQNHFQRRKKRKLETSPANISRPAADNSNS